jgi:ferritin-like metal-binding protein YciE
MTTETMEASLVEELRDLLNSENQLVSALPKMAKAAESEELKKAFQSHLEETREHVERAKRALEALGESARSKKCDAMEGIIEEGSSLIKKHDSGPVLDAMLIGAAQKAEHYEIASYGTVIAWADRLGQRKVSSILKETLDEEKAADEKLTGIAGKINFEAPATV